MDYYTLACFGGRDVPISFSRSLFCSEFANFVTFRKASLIQIIAGLGLVVCCFSRNADQTFRDKSCTRQVVLPDMNAQEF